MVVYTAFGTNYVKPTVFVHDSPTLHRLDVPPPSPPNETVELRGWVRVSGVGLARTYLAQSYPPELASLVARWIAEALQLRAEALAAGGATPRAAWDGDYGNPVLTDIADHPPLPAPTLATCEGGCPSCPVLDAEPMFVEHGNGATTGMTPEQHFAFARGRQEDAVILSTEALEGIRESVAFESDSGLEEIDAFRCGVAQRWLSQAAALNSARSAWLSGVDERPAPIPKRVHIIFAKRPATDAAFPAI